MRVKNNVTYSREMFSTPRHVVLSVGTECQFILKCLWIDRNAKN